jgi:transcriptional regulator with XRE-family HTH domain
MTEQSKRIRNRRKTLGISQVTLAEQIGTNQAQISKYESGESVPPSDTLAELSRVLGVSADWLLGLTDEVSSTAYQEKLSTKERQAVSAWRRGERLKAIKTIVMDEQADASA